MQKVVPNIWCYGNAEAVGDYYASIFPKSSSAIESRYPQEGLLEFQQPLAGKPLTVALSIWGTRLVLINAGPEFRPNPAISFMLSFDPSLFDGNEQAARQALDQAWKSLIDDGNILMPLQEYPFSSQYGWVEDRYGVSWQLMFTEAAQEPSPFVLPCLMFGGPAQNRAAEAVDYYVGVFPDSALGQRVPYAEPAGPATAEAVMFSDFTIAGQRLAAMDSGAAQDFSFTSGVSLEVSCRNQKEIDQIWNALSAVPEAEQCGWLTDQFGVSWQIVPENMDELMRRPNAFANLMQMRKLIIDDF